MASVHSFTNAREALREMSEELMNHGDPASPRGQGTLELRNVIITLDDPSDCMSVGIGRNMNKRLAAAEALQLCGGFSDPEVTGNVAPNVRQFRTGGIFSGAYGPRIRPQLMKAVGRLRRDMDSRQAVVTIWDPLHDQQEQVKDIPCTISFNWHIRKGKVHMTTHMRSNDIWWGWTYDVVQFTQLQWTVANLLDMEAGTYVHMVDSLHMYERDIDAASALTQDTVENVKLRGLGAPPYKSDVFAIAQQLFYDQRDPNIVYTDTEQVLHGMLHV